MWRGGRSCIPFGLLYGAGYLLLGEKNKKALRILYLAGLIVLCIGMMRGRTAFASYRSGEEAPLDTTGMVIQLRTTEYGVSAVMKSVDDQRILVRMEEHDIREGDFIRVVGTGTVPQPSANPGNFNTLIYDGARGIRWEMTPDRINVISRGHRPYVYRYLFLSRMRNVLNSLLPQEQEGAIMAILTGDRSEMDKGMTEAFQDCGIAHIIAVSGLHIQVLCMLLEGCLTKVFARRKALIMSTAAIWAYCFMTGGAVSTLRAALMLSIRLGAVLCGRKEDPLNSLGISTIVILVWRPLYLFDSAFQLSFMSTISLFAARRPWLRLYWIPKKLRQSLAASLAVVTWTMPVTLSHFHQISLYAVLLNLIVIPLMSIVIMMSIAAVLVSFISSGIARFLVGCVYYVLVFYRSSCDFLLQWSGGILRIGAMPGLAIVVFYLLYLLWILPNAWEGKCLKYLPAAKMICLAMLILVMMHQHFKTQVLFLSVGQGDCALIRSRGRAYLIDAGPGYDRAIKPCLTYYGIRTIDGIFLTHMDQDHSEGVQRMLTDRDFRVRNLYLPNQKIHDFRELLIETDAKVHDLEAGRTLYLSGIEMLVLSPKADLSYTDENSASLCLQARMKHGTIDFMGDADQAAEEKILASGAPVRCDILKAGHHGSRTSSSEVFLEAAAPQAAFISCKKNNSYGHPHQEVIDRMQALGIHPVISYEGGCLIMDGRIYAYQEAFRKRWMQ